MACQWSGVAMSTASMSFCSSSRRKSLNSFAEVPAHSLALARWGGYKSPTATNSAFGTSRISFASNMPRPPQPMRPTRTRSFAPSTSFPERAVADTTAPVCTTRLMNCRRFMQMDLLYSWVFPALRHSQRPQFGIPRFAIRAHQHFRRFRVADDFFLLRVPTNLPADAQRNVRQVTHRRDAMAALQIGVRFLPRLHAVEKIADVPDVLVFPIARGVFGRLSPKFLPAFSGHGLRPADRMSADDARHNVDRVLFFIRRNFKAVAAENHCAFVSMKRHAAHARLRHTGGALAKLAHGLEAGVFDDHVLNVRHLAVVFQEKSSAGARHCRWPFHTGDPVDRVERVLAEVGHLAAGVIPEPAEMVDGAVRIVRPLRRRAEPHFIIQFRRRISIGRIAKSRRDVAKIVALNGNKFAEPPAADEFARLLIMRTGTLLGSDLHDAFMAARRFDHPTSFAHKQRQ